MKLLFCMMVAISFVGCVAPDESASSEFQVSTTEQGLNLCSSTCDPPAYNGVAVGCASATFCISAPEAAYCLQPDGSYLAAACATGPVVRCGDGTCSASEDHWSCPADCGPVCGDGVCENSEHGSCNRDCWWWCPTCNEP